MLSKVSVDEESMHYFQNMSSASGAFAPHTPNVCTPLDPTGNSSSTDSLICLLLEKVLRGFVHRTILFDHMLMFVDFLSNHRCSWTYWWIKNI